MRERGRPIRQIDVAVAESFQDELREGWLRMVVEAGLDEALPVDEPAQVSLLVTDDNALRDLNLRFRGLDEVTDVLSFSASHPGHWPGDAEEPEDRYLKPGDCGEFPFVLPPGELPALGEVIVSYPQTLRQAMARQQPVDQELALLIVHGVLHLVGQDHLEPGEKERMQTKEQAALAAVFQAGAHSE